MPSKIKTFTELLSEFPPFDVIARLQKHGGLLKVSKMLGVSERTVHRMNELFVWDNIPTGVMSRCFELLGVSPTRLCDLREAKKRAAAGYRPYPWLSDRAWGNFCRKAEMALTKRK